MHINTTVLVYLVSCAYIVSTTIILVYVTELNTTPSRAGKHSLGPPSLTFCTDEPDTGSKTGFDLVEDVSETMEISEYSTKESFSDTGVRCFRHGLGSSMSQPENINRRCMECARNDSPYPLVGTSMLCFEPIKDVHIYLRIDNTAVVAYVNKTGGLQSEHLCQLALQVWNWCLSRSLTISAEHLPGSLN